MGKRKFILLLLLLIISLVAALLLQHVAPEEPTATDDDDQYYNIKRTCNSTIGECNAEEEEDEMMMESEISRRLLAGRGSGKTISYGVTGKDKALSCGNGKSYRTCLPAGYVKASRGCNQPVYRCRGNAH